MSETFASQTPVPSAISPIVSTSDAAESQDSGSSHLSLYVESIQAGCQAPSADNNQPWMFQPSCDGLHVYRDRVRQLPSDVDGMFDLLSLGAVIENIAIWFGAKQLGIDCVLGGMTQFVEVPADADHEHLATIRISSAAPRTLGRFNDLIDSRHTNRFPYQRQVLPADTLCKLEGSVGGDCGTQVEWLSDRSSISRCANLVGLSDSLRFRYQAFHEELHRQLRLSAQESESTQDGLDYRTLGLPPGATFFLRAIKPWKRMALLNRLGAASLMSLPSINLVRCSGAIGFLFAKDRTMGSLINGGRAMQRIWLQAEELGLALQPLGSLPIFLANESLPNELQPLAKKIKDRTSQIVPRSDGFLQMAFRIGQPKRRPPLTSFRRPASDVTLTHQVVSRGDTE